MKTQAYFQDIQKEIINQISSAKSSILIAVAWMTDQSIFNVLLKKAKDGVKIELLLVNDEINNEKTRIQHKDLEDFGGCVYFITPTIEGAIMHHKFCVIDDNIVITGSYNWSNRAKQNDENIIITRGSPDLVDQFNSEFISIKERLVDSNSTNFEQNNILVPCCYQSKPDKKGFSTPDFKKVIIPCIFDNVENFVDGIARVVLNGKIRFVVRNGNAMGSIIHPGDDPFIEKEFINGLQVACMSILDSSCMAITSSYDMIITSKEYGYVDVTKYPMIRIPFIYDHAFEFSDGLALVQYKGKYGYINERGNAEIDYKYDSADSFKKGIASVGINGKYGAIDIKGKTVIPLHCDYCFVFPEGIVVVKYKGKFGFFDPVGNEVIPFLYDDFEGLGEGLAAVKINNKWGFIDVNGNQAIAFVYDQVKYFREGLAAVRLNKKWGFIDKTGAQIIPYIYDETWYFKDGKASVHMNYNFLDYFIMFFKGRFTKSKIKYGYIDKNGKQYWED